MEFFEHSVFFGVSLSLLAYGLGVVLQKRFRLALFNPLLLSVIVTILVLVTAHIDYEVYYAGAKYLSYLLTPATVCLAVPLYEKFALLRSSWRAILAGILSGVLTTLCSVLALSLAFRLSHEEYVTLLPKSITTAIGMGVSEELGGYVTLTVAMIIITGILGNVIAVAVCRVFRITEPIAKGVAIGSAAHALGTAKAIEIGEVEGAMSGLSIVVAGLLTVVGASVFANFLRGKRVPCPHGQGTPFCCFTGISSRRRGGCSRARASPCGRGTPRRRNTSRPSGSSARRHGT